MEGQLMMTALPQLSPRDALIQVLLWPGNRHAKLAPQIGCGLYGCHWAIN
ncbi:hypothetical protein DLM_3053 [Aquitalea magnusonii]|uniref:Uncharacterized protein n=1 Tax=Aquitalea magnusonii TaxID=332411 RepID=A0A3G9GK99_9NEIS|nr:hypothetical protein DLM_3053 [Aquitalea magnusonii]